MDCPVLLNPHTKTLLQNPENDNTQKKSMENFQKVIFKLAETQPNAPLSPAARTLLQDRLSRFVSQYKTPDHPPYSAMIERAIRELNEKRGSSEYCISRFLEREYDNLPWAHSTMLKHHLRNLCESGDIVVTHNKRYKLAGEIEIPILNSPSTKKVKRKPPSRTRWRWDWERERERVRRRKRRLINLRIQQKGKKVKVIEKHQEYDEKEEDQLTEENVGNPVFRDLSNLPTRVNLQQQEIGPSEIMNDDVSAGHTQDHPERQQSEYSRPEIPKPPSFESTRVENLPNSGSAQLEPTSAEEFLDSERSRRQMRRWNRSYPEPKAVSMISVELVMTSHEPDENNHSLLSGHSNLLETPRETLDSNRVSVEEQMHHENDVKSLVKGDEKYSRRRETKSKQSEIIATDVHSKIDSPDLPLSLNQPEFASSNEKGPQDLLQHPPPQHKEKKQPRRSLRLRSAKPEVTKDVNVVIALPSQHCEPSKEEPVIQLHPLEPTKPTADCNSLGTEVEKPTARRVGRPPKRLRAWPNNKDLMKKSPAIVALDQSDCGQLPKRGRGRSPKLNAIAS